MAQFQTDFKQGAYAWQMITPEILRGMSATSSFSRRIALSVPPMPSTSPAPATMALKSSIPTTKTSLPPPNTSAFAHVMSSGNGNEVPASRRRLKQAPAPDFEFSACLIPGLR